MAKTPAQRQAEYRKRQDRGDGHRLNAWINSDAHFALRRLIERKGIMLLSDSREYLGTEGWKLMTEGVQIFT